MEKMIFACMVDSRSSGAETLILAASIRKFGGIFADSQIWALQPEFKEEIPKEVRNRLESYGVKIIPFSVSPRVLKFPFASFVLAAATIESFAEGKTEFLAWLTSDTLIISEPEQFLLDGSKNLGYRPVHHTLVGSIYEKPIDPFWKLIYQKYNVSEDKIFPMKTHVDSNTLRPYFNAGCLIVRPEKGLLQLWWRTFEEIYDDPSFKEFYKKNELYTIFIHQAVLAGVILSTMEKEELQELSFAYNYPLHLYPESPVEFQPQNINDLITARYEETKVLEETPFQDPLKSWLINLINTIPQKSSLPSQKIKFGRTPIVYPIPIILAGALVHEKPNFETLGDVGIMGINPPIVYISSGQDHYTNIGILEHGNFSINFPSTKLLTKTDYCGTVSGHSVDKSQLFDVFFGELETAPMIRECPVNLECKVIKEFSIQHRQIFIGEVVQSYVDNEFVDISNGNQRITDMTRLDPIIYALDNRYYKIGGQIGVGYDESKKFKH